MLKSLLISKVRVKLLEIFFSDPTGMYHVRDLVRRTDEEINAVRRELLHLEEGSVLQKEQRGNRLYYWPRSDYPLFEDLLSMVAKSTGLGGLLNKNRNKLGRVRLIMLSEKYVRHLPRTNTDDVDLLVVGNVVLPELSLMVRGEEAKREGEINYTVMTEDEFRFRKSRRDPFLMRILLGSRIMVVGTQEELVGVLPE
jgi:hypothetical protein